MCSPSWDPTAENRSAAPSHTRPKSLPATDRGTEPALSWTYRRQARSLGSISRLSFRSRGAHIGYSLGFSLRDLHLGHRGAARDKLFHLGLRFGSDPLGLGLGT